MTDTGESVRPPTKPAPLPYSVYVHNWDDVDHVYVYDANNEAVATMELSDDDTATANLMVMSTNLHGRLVTSLERILQTRRNMIQAAIDGKTFLLDAAQQDIQDAIVEAEKLLAEIEEGKP